MRRSPEEEEIMFGKQLRLKRFFGGIVVTAAVGVVVVPAALSSTSARGSSAGPAPDVLARYVANHSGEMQQTQGYRFVTDTLGGARHLVVAQQVAQQVGPNRFTSDPIAGVHGYNPNAYVVGGSTPLFAQAAQDLGYGRTPAPAATGSPTGTGPNWKDIGIAAGFVAALLLLLLASTQIRNGRRGGVTTA
jgi:hypothetical protein